MASVSSCVSNDGLLYSSPTPRDVSRRVNMGNTLLVSPSRLLSSVGFLLGVVDGASTSATLS